MERDIVYNFYDKAMVNNLEGNAQMITYPEVNQNTNIQHEVKSRTQEYADKWDMNMFLNDFKEWDENAGVNVKLSDVYLEEHLPHFKWKNNSKESAKLKELLSEYINEYHGKKMLLILGQPGIGKSTLITWITANFKDRKDNILVYQFAANLKDIDWSNTDKDSSLVDIILKKLNLTCDSLNGKTLIIDGFDEISVGGDRADILNKIYWQFKEKSLLKDFSLIITCREHYIDSLQKLSCDYITLQPWNEEQIKSFCTVYSNITEYELSENTIMNILKNKDVFGIPLILYMVLALNISIDYESSIVDAYDKIFALEGGIYDRCIDKENYAGPHRISEIKKQIHQVSREIAFWMFENEPDEASILKNNYQEICNMVIKENQYKKETVEQDFLLGNYFKKIRHCDGIETEEISFVHRTIYEYFVAEMIYNSIEETMIELSDESQKIFAGNIAWFLKKRELTYTITEYLKHKILKLYNKLDVVKRKNFYQWWENAVGKMMTNGMFYYTKRNIQDFNDIICKEVKCFLNVIEILKRICIVCGEKYILSSIDRDILEKYIRYSSAAVEYMFRGDKILALECIDISFINLSRVNLSKVNFSKANLYGAKLNEANLRGTDLRGADLCGVNLGKTDLTMANLRGNDLCGVNLFEANLTGADLRETDLRGAGLTGVKLFETTININLLKETEIEDSIWDKYDIQKFMSQLKEIEFEHIIIEDENGQKRVSKNELFPDLQ